MSWTVSGSLLLPKADVEESEEEEATDAPEEAGDQWFIICKMCLCICSLGYEFYLRHPVSPLASKLHSAVGIWNDRVKQVLHTTL